MSNERWKEEKMKGRKKKRNPFCGEARNGETWRHVRQQTNSTRKEQPESLSQDQARPHDRDDLTKTSPRFSAHLPRKIDQNSGPPIANAKRRKTGKER